MGVLLRLTVGDLVGLSWFLGVFLGLGAVSFLVGLIVGLIVGQRLERAIAPRQITRKDGER